MEREKNLQYKKQKQKLIKKKHIWVEMNFAHDYYCHIYLDVYLFVFVVHHTICGEYRE